MERSSEAEKREEVADACVFSAACKGPYNAAAFKEGPILNVLNFLHVASSQHRSSLVLFREACYSIMYKSKKTQEL